MRRLECAGSLIRSCPTHAWWFFPGTKGAPRKRCNTCFLQHQRERKFLDHAVASGTDEPDAVVALLLREARAAVSVHNHAESMRLVQRAMASLTTLVSSRQRFA